MRDDDPTRATRDHTVTRDPALDPTLPSPDHTTAPAPSPAHDAQHPGARLGRYVLGEQLGAGGMGVVFRARDPELDRDLAIKLVRPHGSGPQAQERLLAEAKAMAKLHHPAVVPVFDVGTTERGVYVVMPLVRGGTLHDWLHAQRRPWRTVLDKFLAAGRGLAAAHAAQLVHGDFKPRNVLLDDSGDVMVADLGLAETVPASEASADAPARAAPIAGTPAYMAPEQARGEAIDARADQYSFCISLWEGLHGERPADAETRTHGGLPSLATPRNLPVIPADRRGAPRWLLAAIARGFSPARERRWPSMAALLAHVEARRRRPRRIAVGIAAIAVIGAAAALSLTFRGSVPPSCADPRPRLAGIWDVDVRRRIEDRFGSTKVAAAAETLVRITPALDRYAGQWRTTHVAACKATAVQRTQSADLLDRRMLCLDRRLATLGTLTRTLAESKEARVVHGAVDAVASLPAIADCDDAKRLLASVPLPQAPEARTAILALDRELDGVEALRLEGKRREQLDRATQAVAAARRAGYAPVLARALRALVAAQHDTNASAEASLRELAKVAAEAGDDRLVADAWSSLVNDLTVHESRFDEAKALEPVAEAAVLRAGSPPDLRGELLLKTAVSASNRGDADQAITRLRQAIPLLGEERRTRAESLLARALSMKLDHAGALVLAEKVLAEVERRYGPQHPNIADETQFLGQLYGDVGEFEKAEAMLERTLAIQIAVLGEDNVDVGMTLYTIGSTALNRGRYPEAKAAFVRAARILETNGDKRRLGIALAMLGTVRRALYEPIEETRKDHERGLELLAETFGKDSEYYALIETDFANRLTEAKLCDDARPYQTHALETLGKIQPGLAVAPLRSRANCALSAGRTGPAVADLDRAIQLCRAHPCRPWELEGAQYQLGELLLTRGLDRRRGVSLLREARAGYERTGKTHLVAELDALLAKESGR